MGTQAHKTKAKPPLRPIHAALVVGSTVFKLVPLDGRLIADGKDCNSVIDPADMTVTFSTSIGEAAFGRMILHALDMAVDRERACYGVSASPPLA